MREIGIKNYPCILLNGDIVRARRGLGIIRGVPAHDLSPRKVRLFKAFTIRRSLDNCLVMCMFPSWTVQQKVDIVAAVMGWDISAAELMQLSERAINLARPFNVREDFSADDDWLPTRFFTPRSLQDPLKHRG